ncbi:MAG: precorrin-3B C(17)-methyltransferase [Lachnospiraceae bacterium]|jgi:precorrin-3B C17-methyltransferase|nr:precorrin-3B C(17)-methyltransferase [Lachnospiraceae bacterium]
MTELLIVGIGPGSYEKMTVEAVKALEQCQVIVGYTVYAQLVQEYFPDKEYLTTPMKQEVKRCRIALEKAANGQSTALVCSGDSGVYGMAGLALELLFEFPEVKVRVIPGVTAALAGGAVLGAPLTHDFAVISLSDLLTPFETIQARVRAAASVDFAICIYNPSSQKRKGYLKMACEIVMEYQSKDTVCGIVSNIGRKGQAMEILSLGELAEKETDMFTTVFIGNSRTKQTGGYMVTPRGYSF